MTLADSLAFCFLSFQVHLSELHCKHFGNLWTHNERKLDLMQRF